MNQETFNPNWGKVSENPYYPPKGPWAHPRRLQEEFARKFGDAVNHLSPDEAANLDRAMRELRVAEAAAIISQILKTRASQPIEC